MIKLFRKNHFLRNKVHNTSCILNHASPRHLKQYSRKRTNESLSLFASELDRKPSMVKRRESRHVQSLRGIDLWLWYSLPFDSLRIRLRRRKWKSKQKSVEPGHSGTECRCTPWKRRFPETIFQRGSPRREKVEIDGEKLLVKVDETSYPCQRSSIIPSMIDILKEKNSLRLSKVLFPACFFDRFSQ